MTRPSFSKEISLGNIMSIFTMVAIGISAFVVMDQRSEANAKAIEKL